MASFSNTGKDAAQQNSAFIFQTRAFSTSTSTGSPAVNQGSTVMPQPANAVPLGVCGLDPTSGDSYAVGLCNVTAITTAGTTTIASGRQGAFFGFNAISLGTSFTAQAYDIGTNTLALTGINTAAAIGPQGYPGPPGLGVRYANSLVVVTTGTAGQYNALWD